MKRWFLLIAIAVGVGLAIGLAFRSMNPQKQRMAMAEEHIPKIKSKIAGDHRFDKVAISSYTDWGCLQIRGTVAQEADLKALHEIVEATSPPVLVKWKVLVELSDRAQSTSLTGP